MIPAFIFLSSLLVFLPHITRCDEHIDLHAMTISFPPPLQSIVVVSVLGMRVKAPTPAGACSRLRSADASHRSQPLNDLCCLA